MNKKPSNLTAQDTTLSKLGETTLERFRTQQDFVNAELAMNKMQLFVQFQQALNFVESNQKNVVELPGFKDWQNAREAFQNALQAEAEAINNVTKVNPQAN